MQYLLLFLSFHFLIMSALVLLFSGIITLFTRLHFIFIVLVSMVAGYIYTIFLIEIPELSFFAISVNGILSHIAIGIVKIALYSNKKVRNFD